MFSGFDGHKKDIITEASIILSAYLDKEDIVNAEKILKLANASFNGGCNDHQEIRNVMTQKVYDYYIKHGNYDKARNLIETSESGYRMWGTHIKDVVFSLCKDGKKDEAQKYLNQYAPNIDNNSDQLGHNNYVTKLIQDIINTY